MTELSRTDQPFSRGLSLTTFGAVLGVGIDFCSFTLAARSVSKSEFGVFVLFLVMARFAQVASDIGLRQTVVQHLSSGVGTPAHIFQLGFSIQTVTAFVIAAGLLAFGSPVATVVVHGPLPKSFVLYLCLMVIVGGCTRYCPAHCKVSAGIAVTLRENSVDR